MMVVMQLVKPSPQEGWPGRWDVHEITPTSSGSPRAAHCCLPAELAEALAQSMAEADELGGARPGGPPPASKHAVRALPRERLTEARLQELGGAEARCSVCRWGCFFSVSPVLSPRLVSWRSLCAPPLQAVLVRS